MEFETKVVFTHKYGCKPIETGVTSYKKRSVLVDISHRPLWQRNKFSLSRHLTHGLGLLRRRQKPPHYKATAKVFIVPCQFEKHAHGIRSTTVVISVLTFVISL